MSIYNMYGAKKKKPIDEEKNPNRVVGGLKSQGADSFKMLDEHGQEKLIPTQAYVKGVEEQVRRLTMLVTEQAKDIRRLANDQQMVKQAIERANKF